MEGIPPSLVSAQVESQKTKKADVAEDPKVFCHVGLLINEPPGTCRVAPYLVVRRLQNSFCVEIVPITAWFHAHLSLLHQ
jgi:hypothetical protein